MTRASYFLISVSNRENLDLCLKYALAGFPSGANGAWTFCELGNGDFVSFLYGARAHNLYEVVSREAIKDASHLPPWKPLTFEESGKTYSFPFRVQLKPIRTFDEQLVRAEFSYVAENLLLRGGYRRTHFQADQTTLQGVSQMGVLSDGSIERLSLPGHTTFNPSFTRAPGLVNVPEVCRFQETILQTAIRRHLLEQSNLAAFLQAVNLGTPPADDLEILGEKALPEGHIDLFLKERVPLGSALKIPIEVKLNRAQPRDVLQLIEYMKELAGECPLGILIAAEFSKRALQKAFGLGIKLVPYTLQADLKKTPTFEEIRGGLRLEAVRP